MKKIFGTKEWAQETLDIQVGCSNGCRYCYAKAEAIRFKRKTRANWSTCERLPDVKMQKILASKIPLTVMFPTHHDIDTRNMVTATLAIGALVDAGHQVLVVSKPDPFVIERICRNLGSIPGMRTLVEFRFTIGSAIRSTLKYWEPMAPSLGDRLESLIIARQSQFRTSVSIEPMLDSMPERVVDIVRPHVTESIWIGLPNFLAQRLAINGESTEVKKMGKELMGLFTDEVIIRIFRNLTADPLIRWKESMRMRLGMEPTNKSPEVEQKAAKDKVA